MPFSLLAKRAPSQEISLDSGVMRKILHITSYNHYHHTLHGRHSEDTLEQLSTMQLKTIHVMRKQENFMLASKLLRFLPLLYNDDKSREEKYKIVNIDREEASHGRLCELLFKDLEKFRSLNINSRTRTQIYNETAKLLHALGSNVRASQVLCDCIILNRTGSSDAQTDVLNAKALCTLAKWISVDKKVLSNNEELRKILDTIINDDSKGTSKLSSNFEDVEAICGRLFALGSQVAPDFDKAWFMLAAWAYKAGRKIIEQAW